MTGSLTLSLSA